MYSNNHPTAVLGTTPVLAAASTTVYSQSFSVNGSGPNLGSMNTSLGVIVNVTAPGLGTCEIQLQTAVQDASDSDLTQWMTCPYSTVYGFSLTAANTSRIQVCDFILDKLRVALVGDATASATLSVAILGDGTLSA